MPIARVGGMDDVGGPQDWFNSLPIITRYWFGGSCALTLLANFGVVSPYKLLFLWPSIKDNFEIWRFASCFCYAGPFSFNMVISLYMMVTFSKMYESGGPFNSGAGGGTADYAFALMFAMTTALITYPLLRGVFPLQPLFTNTLIYFVLYTWSKRNPTANANIWGVPVKGIYLPFAYLALTVVLGNPYFDMLHGIAIGHIYYFLVDVLPLVHGKTVLNTPAFLIDFFGVGEYTPAPPPVNPAFQAQNRGGFGNAAARQEPPAAAPRGGHQWGQGGQRLGTQ